ncbi:MAG: FIST C-terminal domain-containing protein [Proteobacteria bacterium]|nr:FIST C-terminal domain-containing protein [Pseudomonadota bacterium]MBI3499254.1 FIST C-terminal domain-containing protein [Pseudomonadota bacterium]
MIDFASAHAEGEDWRRLVTHCLERLGSLPASANLGFVYATDAFAGDFAEIVEQLKQSTRIPAWVGTVGIGVSATQIESFDRPALSVMVASLPEDGFRIFSEVEHDLGEFRRRHGAWIAQKRPSLGIVHADPRNQRVAELVRALADETPCFLAGGLTASRSSFPQVAGGMTSRGLSGVLFAESVEVACGLSQGCSPIGPVRTVTQAEENVIMELDDENALEVFKEDIGEVLARDLRRIGGYIYIAFPVPGSDTGDYTVRNLVGIDPKEGHLGIGDYVSTGDRIVVCRRDRQTAATDLQRMLTGLKRRGNARPRGGLYFSCVARGPNMFGPDSEELRSIAGELGDFPLVGFYANGEISHNRLYGYTGVLAVFL